ncbi:hypothetical protein OPS25_03890 [Alteromonas ponticola]|uniref:Uncharacterized protein n=1 Tax=Alteromonas aquimaris TaxID=2998417 RepID=A0ABT3P4E9_9ALTE|nr:hypothetical protein [Alteromonas aquimaris]MCW8107647.1 hypothetical protein [Alteromonas aquimaris]
MNDSQNNPIANMEGMQAAIANGELKRLRELLGNQKLDTLQKDYLIELAELNGNEDVVTLLKGVPTK